MSNESNIWRGRYCVFKVARDWVVATKHRHRLFNARVIDVLRGIFAEVCAHAQVTLVEMDILERRVVDRPPIHRATEDPEVTFTAASLSALPFPELKDGGLPRVLVETCLELIRAVIRDRDRIK